MRWATKGCSRLRGASTKGRGVTFRRFANYRVRGAMLDGVRKSAPMPRRAHARVRALEAALLLSESAAEDAAGAPAQANPDAAAMEQKLTAHLADMATAMAVGLRDPGHRRRGRARRSRPRLRPRKRWQTPSCGGSSVEALEDLPEDERTLIGRHYLEGERFDPSRLRSGSRSRGEPAAHSCSSEVDQEAPVAGPRSEQSTQLGAPAYRGGWQLPPQLFPPRELHACHAIVRIHHPPSDGARCTAFGRAPRRPSPSRFGQLLRGMGHELDRGEALAERAIHGGAGGGSMSPEALIALQAGIYRYSEAVDFVTKVVDRATQAVKTTLQNQ